MNDHIRTKDVAVTGEMNVIMAVVALISRSVWFQLTPCPEDHWVITVKIEQRIDERGRPL